MKSVQIKNLEYINHLRILIETVSTIVSGKQKLTFTTEGLQFESMEKKFNVEITERLKWEGKDRAELFTTRIPKETKS